eukprot:14267403-Alexandrium_andersonii.AAC.1
MSASLVGSEMCIRDSDSAPQALPRVPREGAPSCSVEASSHVGRRSQAVSYTHLTLPTICSV